MTTIENIKNEINRAKNVVILTHQNPDGDAIGSSLAMQLVLKKMGKEVDVIIPEFPNTFKFLPGADLVKKKEKKLHTI